MQQGIEPELEIDALAPVAPDAAIASQHVHQLRTACDAAGSLPAARRGELASLVYLLEASLE